MPTNLQPDTSEQEQPQGGNIVPFPVLTRALASRGSQQSLVLRQRALQDKEILTQQTMEVKAQQMELSKVHQMAELMKEQGRIRDGMEKQRQVMLATKSLGELDHSAPDFETKLLQAQAKAPLGFEDAMVQKSVAHYRNLNELTARNKAALDLHNQENAGTTGELVKREDALLPGRTATAGAEEKARQAAREKDKADPADEMNTAIAAGKVTGHGTFKGNNFVAGDEKTATHVQVEYQDPKTGKYEVNQIPVDSYKQAVMANTPASETAPAAKPVVKMKFDNGQLVPVQ